MTDSIIDLYTHRENLQWCRKVWTMLAPGGVWGVPRSGLTFHKTESGLELISRALHPTPGWAEYQENDYLAIKEQFELAGYTVTEA